MNFDCKIKSILEARSGLTSEQKQWYSQPIEVEWQEAKTRSDGTIYATDQSLVVELTGDIVKNFTLPVGQAITIDVRFESREWQGKKINNLRSKFLILR